MVHYIFYVGTRLKYYVKSARDKSYFIIGERTFLF